MRDYIDSQLIETKKNIKRNEFMLNATTVSLDFPVFNVEMNEMNHSNALTKKKYVDSKISHSVK